MTKNKITNFLKMANRIFGRYRRQIAMLSLLSFLNGLLEGISVTTLIPIFSFIVKNQGGGNDFISKTLQNFFLYFNLSFNLKNLLIFISLLFIAKFIALFLAKYLCIKITTNCEITLRGELFSSALKAGWPYLSKQKIGYLEQILITDVNNTSNLLFTISNFILFIFKLIIYIFIAINISMSITLLALITGLITILIFKGFFYKNKIISQRTEKLYKQMAHFVNESIIGLKTIKSMSLEESIIKKGLNLFNDLRKFSIDVTITRNIPNVLSQPIGLIFVAGTFIYLYKTTVFNLASFAVIIYAINKIFLLVQDMQGQLHGMVSLWPFVVNVAENQNIMDKNKESTDGERRFSFNDSLEFRDVNFSYNCQNNTLSHIDFKIHKGETVGLIGPSGAGKTTLVDLLLRHFIPQSGAVLLDGRAINEINIHDWRLHIGYVSQDIFLANDTIENNIKFYDDSLTTEIIEEAARTANIYDFINSLPDKFSTIVGERGIMLSGGQRQRISLARVLARKPEILILDEATSSLDNESESLIQRAIANLKGKITIIIIAHRLSTVMICDCLLGLEDGKIVEEGPPSILLDDKDSYFYRMMHLRDNESSRLQEK